jgi:hypothetical protein
MALPTYNANREGATIAVYYSGTDTLSAGYALCYDQAASATATDPKARLGAQVVKPATANLSFFAGVVAESSAGRVGPCFVDIVVPMSGQIVAAYCNSNSTIATTLLAVQNGQYSLAAQATLSAATLPTLVGVAAETADTSGTAANKYIKFL